MLEFWLFKLQIESSESERSEWRKVADGGLCCLAEDTKIKYQLCKNSLEKH